VTTAGRGCALSESVLVLNQNYEPLNVCGARRAVVLLLRNKAQSLETSEQVLHAAVEEFPVPSVIRLLHMVKRPVFSRRLSRREVFWRDGFTCQYCGKEMRDLTLDHVKPRVHKGPHTWENVVAACVPCNHKKAGRSPSEAGMRLLKEPTAPKANPYYHLMHRELPDAWNIYLPWMQPSRRELAASRALAIA
jgi:5-methylcytosine-specific restriction endonuclease McrA